MPARLYMRGKWLETGEMRVIGHAFAAGRLCNEADISALLAPISSAAEWAQALGQLNGFFAVVKQTDSAVLLAVDRIRSIPLFYSVAGDRIFVSDDAHWVCEQVGDAAYDDVCATEFRLTGYVTGSQTLYPHVRQVQAGEIVLIRMDPGQSQSVETARYYRFVHSAYSTEGPNTLEDQLDAAVMAAFTRLTIFAAGRPIVVPLSGGLDSRLAIMALKRIKYDPVITYSYGRPGNRESRISKEVAGRLGLKWHFVPYSNELWGKWYGSPERADYYAMADGACAVPHAQDWPAVWELTKRGVVPAGSVFVPGHSADLPAGSRSRAVPTIYGDSPVSQDEFFDSLFRFHYSLWDWSEEAPHLRPILQKRVLEAVGDAADTICTDPSNTFEAFDVHERQAKFIVNAVRVYEFWGHDWWLPFWDAEFSGFWTKVPVCHRRGQALYAPYVHRLYGALANVPQTIAKRTDKSRLRWLVHRVLSEVPGYRRARAAAKRAYEYDHNPLAVYGIVSRREFAMLDLAGGGINALVVTKMLNDKPHGGRRTSESEEHHGSI